MFFDNEVLANIFIMGVIAAIICFGLSFRHISSISSNKFGLFIIYLFELLLCIPAGIYTNRRMLRILLCTTLLFTIFACLSHFLEDTDDQFRKVVYKFSNAMIFICMLNLTILLMGRFFS